MIRRLQTILIACLIAVTAWAAGDSVKEYKSVDDVPNVRLTDVRRYVSDPTSILSPAATDTINAILGTAREIHRHRDGGGYATVHRRERHLRLLHLPVP